MTWFVLSGFCTIVWNCSLANASIVSCEYPVNICQFASSSVNWSMYCFNDLDESTSGSTVKVTNSASIPSFSNSFCKDAISYIIGGQTVSQLVNTKLAIQTFPSKSPVPNDCSC